MLLQRWLVGTVALFSLTSCNFLPIGPEFLKVQFVAEPAESWCSLIEVSVERFGRVVASVELTPADQAPSEDTAWSYPLRGGEGYFVTAVCFEKGGSTSTKTAGYRNEGGLANII